MLIRIVNLIKSSAISKSRHKCPVIFHAPRSGLHIGQSHSQIAQKKYAVSGLNINTEQSGHGPHPVLCLPGALGFIESDFGPILPKFSPSKYTVIAWDPPGYGKSRPPARDFSGGSDFFHRDADCAVELMKSLGHTSFSMLGWSDGANTACILAAKFPESVKKLVIWGGNSYITDTDMQLYNPVSDIDSWSERMKAPMFKMYGENYFRETWTAWIDAYAEIYKCGGDIFTKLVPNIKCPTFILHGMKDAMVPYEHAEYFKKHIKNSKLHVLPEGKHNLHLKYAAEFVQMVEEFLDD